MPRKKKEEKSKLVERAEKQLDSGSYQLTPEESKQYGHILTRIVQARNRREAPRDEFDGMSYEQAYLTNKRAMMSYLAPKKNDDEVRINTGTTEKKIELTLNELLSLNLESEIRTFDIDDNLLQDVSEVFTDLVRRTEQIEFADDKDTLIYQELLSQPSVFVEELFIEKPLTNGRITFKRNKRCERRLIQGVQMYLGDIHLDDTRFNEQPYLVKYARMNYEEGERVFKRINEEKWKYVKPGPYISLTPISPKLYRTASLTENEIEVYWYMSYPDDEVQIVINGIPMLELGHKYTKFYSDLAGYHITMVSLKPLSGDFAYGKPLTHSAKTLQALDNETIRNLVRKFRQALEPPIGIKSGGTLFSRDIWNPGKITQGIKKDDFERLIDHQGVTQSEMAMFDLIEKKINEFIGASQQDPLQGKTQVTATELRLAQQQAIRMLGLAVLACTRLKNRLALLRVRNIFNNYTKATSRKFDPIEGKVKEVYARFTVPDVTIGSQNGTRIIQMMDRSLSQEEKQGIFMEEEKAMKRGRPFEFKGVNVEILKNLELYFYANTVAKERESDQLDKALLTDMLNQATAVSGITQRPLNANKLIEKFERVWKEKDLFEKEAPEMMQSIAQQQAVGKGAAGEKLTDMMQGGKMSQMPKIGNIV